MIKPIIPMDPNITGALAVDGIAPIVSGSASTTGNQSALDAHRKDSATKPPNPGKPSAEATVTFPNVVQITFSDISSMQLGTVAVNDWIDFIDAPI